MTIDFVIDLLRWRSAGDVRARLRREHLALVSDRFEAALGAFVRAHVGARLSRLVRALPEISLDRIKTAPETAYRLLYGEATDLVFFLGSALAEGARLGQLDQVPEPVWTALGDHYFPPGPSTGCASSTEDHLQFSEHRVFGAPRLSNGIPVDHVSPFAMRRIGLKTTEYVAFAEEELRATLSKLEVALAGIATASPQAAALVHEFTRVLVLRKDPADAHGFGSFSTERLIGRMAFANAHEHFADPARLANGLVHEAIHAMLYIVEERAHFMVDRASAEHVTVQSPWSGRWLEVHSFLHACLVWFGLWTFWRQAEDTGAFPQARAMQLRDAAHAGFESPAVLVAVAAVEPHLSVAGRIIPDLVRDVRRGVYA